MCIFWLRGQNLNLRPSGFEPNIFGGSLPTNRGGGQMVDNRNRPNTVVETWWTACSSSTVHCTGSQQIESSPLAQPAKFGISLLNTKSSTNSFCHELVILFSGD